MDSTISIARYTTEQLVEALVSVDDEKYFNNALYIYQTLLARKGWHHSEVNALSFGIKNNWFLEGVHMGLIGIPYLNGLLHQIFIENHQTEEKIARLNASLKVQDFFKTQDKI